MLRWTQGLGADRRSRDGLCPAPQTPDLDTRNRESGGRVSKSCGGEVGAPRRASIRAEFLGTLVWTPAGATLRFFARFFRTGPSWIKMHLSSAGTILELWKVLGERQPASSTGLC